MAMENAPMKNWELTLYEMQRKPQEPITDGTKIAVSPRGLQSELMCPICLDILKNTMTTKECLHRFCSECIVTALRNGNKECPTCRKKLISKRSLRQDPNFDALIAKIYPGREEHDAHQNRMLAKFNKQQVNGRTMLLEGGLSSQCGFDSDVAHCRNRRQLESLRIVGNTASESIASEDDAASTTGSINQRQSRVNSDAESGTMDTNSIGCASSSELGLHQHQNRGVLASSSCTTVPEVELMLRPLPSQHSRVHPLTPSTVPSYSASGAFDSTVFQNHHPYQAKLEDTGQLTTASSPRGGSSEGGSDDSLSSTVKYIKVPSNATVAHLVKFLSIRFNLQRCVKDLTANDQNFSLFYYNEATNDYIRLQSHLTLDEISHTICNRLGSLSLYYLHEQS